MPTQLNDKAWRQLIDEDLDWLGNQPRTLERDHVEQCLKWLREFKPEETDRCQRAPKPSREIEPPTESGIIDARPE